MLNIFLKNRLKYLFCLTSFTSYEQKSFIVHIWKLSRSTFMSYKSLVERFSDRFRWEATSVDFITLIEKKCQLCCSFSYSTNHTFYFLSCRWIILRTFSQIRLHIHFFLSLIEEKVGQPFSHSTLNDLHFFLLLFLIDTLSQ